MFNILEELAGSRYSKLYEFYDGYQALQLEQPDPSTNVMNASSVDS